VARIIFYLIINRQEFDDFPVDHWGIVS